MPQSLSSKLKIFISVVIGFISICLGLNRILGGRDTGPIEPKTFNNSDLEELLRKKGHLIDMYRIMNHELTKELIEVINEGLGKSVYKYKDRKEYLAQYNAFMVTLGQLLSSKPGSYWTNTTDNMGLITRRLRKIDSQDNLSWLEKARCTLSDGPLRVPMEEMQRNLGSYLMDIQDSRYSTRVSCLDSGIHRSIVVAETNLPQGE